MVYLLRTIAIIILGISIGTQAAVEHYQIDPTHTFPNLEFSHMGISIWRGKFNQTSGEITLDREAKIGTVKVNVNPASINFGLKEMDDMAMSEEFFNVVKFPQATYTGKIVFKGDLPAKVVGEITLLGVSRPLTLDINLFNCIEHPMLQTQVCGADASGQVNWSEYGMKKSEYGKGDAGIVTLHIQVEAFLQNDH